MFRQFIFNVIENGFADNIYPLPATTTSAFHLLKRLGIVPDLIYIDAGHEEEEVAVDVKLYYDLLREGGVLFGDDYVTCWMGVIRAVDRFCADRGLPLEVSGVKWHVAKPR